MFYYNTLNFFELKCQNHVFGSSFLEYCTSKEHVILVKKLRTSKWDSEGKSKYAILQIALKASQWSIFRPPIKKIQKKDQRRTFF